MVDQMTAARQAVGPNVDICADMHARYDYPTGQQVAKRMEPLNLMWLEEPVPAENVDAYKLIAQETSTPICAGENIFLAHGFRRLLEMGGVDIIMPDLQKAGGLGEGQRIANLANLYYVPFAPHMVASFLGAMASCHVCASVPNFMILEWQTYFDTNSHVQGDGDLRRTAGREGLHQGFGEARDRRGDQRRSHAQVRRRRACRSSNSGPGNWSQELGPERRHRSLHTIGTTGRQERNV